jgi:tetratricopeptide (TPR) repeat protein
LEEAETLLLEAINIVEGWAGENHHHTARPVHNLGQVYKKQNQLNKALELFQRSLAINSSRLPADHPDVIEDLLALTDIYILSMDKRKANEYSKRLLALEFDQKERWGLDELQKRIDSM